MDAIFSKYDFKKATKATKEKMEDAISDWRDTREEVVDKKMVLKSLTLLQGKVCVDGIPTEYSDGGEMVIAAFGEVFDCIEFLISEEKASPKDFHSPLLELIFKLISCGPGTVHVEILDKIYSRYHLDMDEYVQTLKPDAVKRIITVCKREYKYKEKIELQDYCNKVQSCMSYLLERSFSDEQVKAQQADFLELYMFFKQIGLDKTEEELDMYDRMADMISGHVGGNIMAGVTDPSMYNNNMKKYKDMIQDAKYPKNEKVVNAVESGMSSIFKALQEDASAIAQVYESMMDFSADVYEMKPCEQVYKVVDSVDDFFFRIDEDVGKKFKKKEFYVAYLKRMKRLVVHKTFPKDDAAAECVTKSFCSMFSDLKNFVRFKEIFEEIIDLTVAVFQQKDGCKVHKVVETIGHYFDNIDKAQVKGNAKLFEGICPKLTGIVEGCKDHTLLDCKFADAIVREILVKTMTNSGQHVGMFIKLLTTLVKVPLESTLYGAYWGLREQDKNLKWKQNVPSVREMFDALSKVKVPDTDKRKKVLNKYKDFTETFLEQLKKARVNQEINDDMVKFALGVVKGKSSGLYGMASEMAERAEFDAKKNKNLVMSVFKAYAPLLKDNSYPWLEDDDLKSLTRDIIHNAMDGVKNGNVLEEEDYQAIIDVIMACFNKDFINEHTGDVGNLFHNIVTYLLREVLQKLADINKIEWGERLYGPLISFYEHEEEGMRDIADHVLMTICQNNGKALAVYMDKMVPAFFQHETFSLIYAIDSSYKENPGPVNKQFKAFMDYMEIGNQSVMSYVIQLYAKVAKKSPELFEEKFLKKFLAESKANQASGVMNLMVLEDVAKRQPKKVAPLLPELLDDKQCPEYALPSLINVLKMLGVKSPEHSDKVMEYFCKKFNGAEEQTLFLCLLDGIRNVGSTKVELLKKNRDLFEKVKGRSSIQYVKDGCTGLIDIIEGRSLATLDDDLKETKEDVKELDVKVTKTDKKVKVVAKEVKEQKKEIKTVKKDVKVQGQKIDQLEETVDETVAKVEEIDSKTLSHAPFWARDVSKLLNPQSEHDWRLLSSRLGYSNDDIRGWAQQHDPCMAMLNEWYAVRKTSEATFAVLTALQEMDRMDAAIIVENAMKMAETVVEDEDFEYAEPPEVFISYQWGMQNEVKLLKQHLERAGYNCWMDIGQMGGGDKLFEKIDQGIRASKVIISCVTQKYAKSPNCNREVNLSVSLGRPIIPLLMEKQTWPPPGSMGPIFSEYLFIRFFTRPGEESGDDRYWSPAKFQELLMQLNYNGIVPDESKVEKEYKNWWIPVVEEIKIEKKKDTGKASTEVKPSQGEEVAPVSPDVFISYQWGKQKQIMLLYRRLMNLGFTCWMDIYQMGGGDSLYDKIDRGVRGCKIVLSCVTTKYSLSANCRREVSLADALKKPILPLLLEKITWPPTGPMSMVFTQLLYINFSKDEKVQETWAGNEFDQLLGKIKDNVPALPEPQQKESKSGPKEKDPKEKAETESKSEPTTNSASKTSKSDPPQTKTVTRPPPSQARAAPTPKETKAPPKAASSNVPARRPSDTKTPASQPAHKNSGRPPPSQANKPQQPQSKKTEISPREAPKKTAPPKNPDIKTPDKTENAPPPPKQPAPKPEETPKSKSCAIL